MALWDKLFKKNDEDARKLNPIVQRVPPPTTPARVSAARPAPSSTPSASEPPSAPSECPSASTPERETKRDTKRRKKSAESGTKLKVRPTDDQTFVKRGLLRQSEGDHDGAIQDFTKAIELNPNCAQAYASRGVSREAKGDGAGAKGDYSKSIQIELMGEINRQLSQNPDVEM